MAEQYDLSRYVKAQEQDFDVALKEIREGYKRSHWMWYIFPQMIGLGQSRTSVMHSIKDLEEAKAYMEEPTLKQHMIEICEALLALETNDAHYIFGSPDDLKFYSSMTLFAVACPDMELFSKVLEKYFEGKKDRRTLEIISWKN